MSNKDPRQLIKSKEENMKFNNEHLIKRKKINMINCKDQKLHLKVKEEEIACKFFLIKLFRQ